MLNLVHVLSLEKDLLLSSRPLAQSESVLASPLSSKLAQTLKKACARSAGKIKQPINALNEN